MQTQVSSIHHGKSRLILLASLVLLILLASCTSGGTQATQTQPTKNQPVQIQPTETTPEQDQPTQAAKQETQPADKVTTQDGGALLQERCTACHNLERVTRAKKTSQQWEQTVERMITKGAKLSDVEKTALVEFLAKTYAP